MTQFKKQDFKDILYPVHELDKTDSIIKSFPKLLEYQEFKEVLKDTLPFDKVFKYIVYAYDQKSPFFLQIDELRKRKILAAVEAGFTSNHKTGFSRDAQKMLNCEDSKVNQMIIRYCRFQGKDFTNLVSSQEVFYQMNLQLMTAVVGDESEKFKIVSDKAKLDAETDKFNERLNEKARKFLSQETAVKLHEDLWTLAEKENIKLTPEDYAI